MCVSERMWEKKPRLLPSSCFVTSLRKMAKSMQHVQQLTVELPAISEVRCIPHDAPNEPDSQVKLEMIDVDTNSPRWEAADFVLPQRIEMQCIPSIPLTRLTLRVWPATIEVLYPNRRIQYEAGVFAAGGLIWLISLIVLRLRSR